MDDNFYAIYAVVLTLLQDHMERFWSNSIFKYLRVEPEDHYFLLTEPVGAIRDIPVQLPY